jgi:hypothetical protein
MILDEIMKGVFLFLFIVVGLFIIVSLAIPMNDTTSYFSDEKEYNINGLPDDGTYVYANDLHENTHDVTVFQYVAGEWRLVNESFIQRINGEVLVDRDALFLD